MSVLRLDKIHPEISGNKWFKLRFYIKDAVDAGKKGIVTFGGAWSNHILATAAACKECGLQSIGLIRGENSSTPSHTLIAAAELGMKLVFLTREQYSRKEMPAELYDHDFLLVPEGGFGYPGAQGAATIVDYILEEFTHICCAVGTGTMTAGLLNGTDATQLVAISVLKNNFDIRDAILSLAPAHAKRLSVVHDYHFGGYARHTLALLTFMNDFYKLTTIPTDFVYTAKLFYAAVDLCKKGYFPAQSSCLIVHSGGLQGNASLPKGSLIF